MEKLLIDGIPLTDRGMWLGGDSYKSLLQWPSLKPVGTNNWAEDDGVEVDLSNPCLDVRNVVLNFVGSGETYEDFVNELTLTSSHDFHFPELGIHLALRLDTASVKVLTSRVQAFSLTFIDDGPYIQNAVPLRDCYWQRPQGISIDGRDYSEYGATVLRGTYLNLRTMPAVKKRLVTASQYTDGADYDLQGSVRFEPADVVVKLLIRQETAIECVRAYYTLLRDMTQPGAHEVFVEEWLASYGCHYKSASVQRVCHGLGSGLWGIAFDVTLTVTDRSAGAIEILTTDDGEFFLTGFDNLLTADRR